MVDHSSRDSASRGWQIGVALFVALGSVATAAYAVIETFWG